MTFVEWYSVGLITFPFFAYIVYITVNKADERRGKKPDKITKITYGDIANMILVMFFFSLFGYVLIFAGGLILCIRIGMSDFWKKEVKFKKKKK